MDCAICSDSIDLRQQSTFKNMQKKERKKKINLLKYMKTTNVVHKLTSNYLH